MDQVLQDYIKQILPKLWDRGYQVRLSKGGAQYRHLSEQTMLAHVLNGAFGFVRLWTYLDSQQILPFDEVQLRQFLSLWTTHDLYKLTPERLGGSTFSLSEQAITEELRALSLDGFANTTWLQHRAAMVSDLSQYQGDLALCPRGTDRLCDMVHVADAMASITSPREASGLWRDVLKLSPRLKDYMLCWHELADVRGIVTNQVHQAVSQVLEQELGLFPLLFFASGTLYIGRKQDVSLQRNDLCKRIAHDVLSTMQPGQVAIDPSQARRKGNTFRFEKFFLLVSHWNNALDFAKQNANDKSSQKFWSEIQDKWFGKQRSKAPPYPAATAMQKEVGITEALAQDAYFNKLWSAAVIYLDFADGLVEDCANVTDRTKRIRWFADVLRVPKERAAQVESRDFSGVTGGKGAGYTVPLAYWWLTGPDFASRSAAERELSEVLEKLDWPIRRALSSVQPSEVAGRVLSDLHLEDDLVSYLAQNLVFSFDSQRMLEKDALGTYAQPKKQSHLKLCSLCGRASEWTQPIQTAIFSDSAQEFSNRLIPRETTDKRREWCPVCYTEFVFRLLCGIAPPPNVDTGKSRRLYLYVMPTYSFTPEMVEMFSGRVLEPFQKTTALQLRDYGEDAPGHQHLWVRSRQLSSDLVDEVIGTFERQAIWIAERLVSNGKERPGERLRTVPTSKLAQPNYLLFVWERTAYGSTKDDAQIPTSSEMWAKAAFAACLLAGLTGCKVYVTELPYLPVSDVGQVKPTVILDSPHNVLRSVLEGSVAEAELNCPRVSASPDDATAPLSASLLEALDVLASVWQVNSELRSRTARQATKDKNVAARLEELGANPLAGAFFYRQYARLNDEQSPFDTYTKACSILLERKGGALMNIATQLAEKSLALFLPLTRYGRGKAHVYELMFRTAVEAIRKAPSADIEETKSFAAGTLLKALERRSQSERSEGIVNPTRGNLNQLAWEFVSILVDEVLVNRARRSVVNFNRLANSLADAIYFQIDRELPSAWERWKETRDAQSEHEGGNE